jgi:hypothetical protein
MTSGKIDHGEISHDSAAELRGLRSLFVDFKFRDMHRGRLGEALLK